MIITRSIINRNIKHHDHKDGALKDYDFDYLSSKVDAYKNLFMAKGAKKGRSVVIGNQANVSQLALVLACAELGLTVVIIGNPAPPVMGGVKLPGIVNTKLALMMPIDYFILDNKLSTEKYEIFEYVCRFTIRIDDHELDYTPNSTIWADEDSVLIRCTSSGTTDTPKVINHTHGFMSELIHRNSKQFYGKMCMMTNLAHGSSPAVYFLPGLISKDVTDYYNFPNIGLVKVAKIFKEQNISMDHLLAPYTLFLDELFSSDESIPGCVLHTLGAIRKSWVIGVKQNRAKDIVSIFGTNETSGPFMINKASFEDFTEDTYTVVDDFYKVELDDTNDLQITIPIYNTKVKTHDTFLKRGDKFVHIGRSNLFRINDLDFDTGKYKVEIDNLSMNAELVVDVKKDNIYLAIWDDVVDDKKVEHIDALMRNDSNGLHFICKHAKLVYTDFLSGVKLDKEMLREYFRNL